MVRPGDPTFLEFQALRKRAESCLPSARPLLIHAGLFLIIPLAQLVAGVRSIFASTPLEMALFALLAVWNLALFAHALAAYLRSGAAHGPRQRAVERALDEGVEADTLSSTDEDYLRLLQRWLDRSIAWRARASHLPVAVFALLIAYGWIQALPSLNILGSAVRFWVWVPFALQLSVFLVYPVLLLWAELGEIAAKRALRVADVSKRKRGAAADAGEKPKRRPVYAVGDDGELVELFDEAPPKTRRDRDPSGLV